VRDLNRGTGPALTAANGPGVVPHPPLVGPASRAQTCFHAARFQAPYRSSSAAAHTNFTRNGCATLAGAASGATTPIAEVSS
jgi:hypothetical protein